MIPLPTRRRGGRWAVAILCASALSACGGGSGGSGFDAQAACSSLAGMQVAASAIGLDLEALAEDQEANSRKTGAGR